MLHLFHDLRYALRLSGRQPVFTLLAALTLALGVGASTAVFTVFNAVLLRPLPYPDPARLVIIRADAPDGTPKAELADAEIADLRGAARLFEDVAGLTAVNGDLTGREGDLPMERVAAASATDNLLPMLGARPVFGRLLDTRIDSAPGRVLSVVISHELWTRRYGADPHLVGRQVEINNLPLAVVGVLPPGFRLHFGTDTNIPPRVDVWFPIGLGGDRQFRSHTTVARLAAGVTLPQAQAELAALATRITEVHPQVYAGSRLRLHAAPLQADAAREAAPALTGLLGAVVLVLLIACANIAHLLLTRTSARSRELAIRSAVGAARPRLVQQLLTEGAALGAAGGALGLLIAQWGNTLLAWLRPASLPPVDPTTDGRVLAFALGVTIASSLLFSVAPALQAFRADVVDALKAGSRGAAPRSRRIRAVLIVSEVALTLVLLVAAGLMLRTVAALHSTDTGFDDRGVLTLRASMRVRDFPTFEQKWAFYRQVLERLQALPGVASVSAVRPLPLEGTTLLERFVAEDRPAHEIPSSSHTTLPGYFATLAIPVLQGRDFVAADLDERRDVAIVDERFAAAAWPGGSAVGRRIRIRRGGRDLVPAEVVGVVAHVRANGLRDDWQPQVYLPYHRNALSEMAVTIRAAGEPLLLAGAARRAIEAVGGRRPVHEIRPMREYVDDAAAESRFLGMLLALFAVFAVVLAAVGLYGVIGYAISQRLREIGVRLALGASPADVRRLVIAEGLRWTAAGIAIGIPAAATLGRTFERLLFGVRPTDPLTFAAVTVLLAAVALCAAAIPAQRAARVDPAVALQAE